MPLIPLDGQSGEQKAPSLGTERFSRLKDRLSVDVHGTGEEIEAVGARTSNLLQFPGKAAPKLWNLWIEDSESLESDADIEFFRGVRDFLSWKDERSSWSTGTIVGLADVRARQEWAKQRMDAEFSSFLESMRAYALRDAQLGILGAGEEIEGFSGIFARNLLRAYEDAPAAQESIGVLCSIIRKRFVNDDKAAAEGIAAIEESKTERGSTWKWYFNSQKLSQYGNLFLLVEAYMENYVEPFLRRREEIRSERINELPKTA